MATPVSRTGATDREVEARCTEEHCGPMCDQVMAERDHYCDVADQLASLLAPPEVLGEHSSMNDPWQNAIDHAEARHATAARAAAAPDSGQRERLARWLFERSYPDRVLASPQDATWDEWSDRSQEEWRTEADAVLALLAEQPGGGR